VTPLSTSRLTTYLDSSRKGHGGATASGSDCSRISGMKLSVCPVTSLAKDASAAPGQPAAYAER